MAGLTGSPVLEAHGLTRRFGGLTAVADVTLEVSDGDVVGVAGPNGAGKSTLLDLLSGRQRPTSGEVLLQGRSVTRAAAHVRARAGMARSYQAPQTADSLSVAEVVGAARVAFGARVPAARVDHVFRSFGIDPRSPRLAGELDTLSRRKVLLACELLRQPRILLLDEPCSGLLQEEILEFEQIVRGLSIDGTDYADPIPAIVIEHRLELLEAVTTRTIVMDAGRVIAEGPFSEVFARDEVRKAYFLDDTAGATP